MKFSLRDLFLVTMIAALTVGWWVDRSRLAAECKGLNDWADEREDEWLHKLEEYRREISSLRSQVLPNSSAPAPSPAKD
jgi:hypothetical protein